MAPLLDEQARSLGTAAESVAVAMAVRALCRRLRGWPAETIRNGRRESAQGVDDTGRI
jgi:hypothetical protein